MRESLADKFAQVSRVSAGCDGEIMRDVIRTFQKQRFFQRGQPGQRMLLHILFGLAADRPDVGYCQVRKDYIIILTFLSLRAMCVTYLLLLFMEFMLFRFFCILFHNFDNRHTFHLGHELCGGFAVAGPHPRTVHGYRPLHATHRRKRRRYVCTLYFSRLWMSTDQRLCPVVCARPVYIATHLVIQWKLILCTSSLRQWPWRLRKKSPLRIRIRITLPERVGSKWPPVLCAR